MSIVLMLAMFSHALPMAGQALIGNANTTPAPNAAPESPGASPLPGNGNQNVQNYVPDTLMGASALQSGFTGAALYRVANVNNDSGGMIGLRGHWVVNHFLSLGVAGYYSVVNPALQPSIGNTAAPSRFLNFGYGGADLAYTLFSESLLHVNLRGFVGAGGVSHFASAGGDRVGPSVMYVGEPSAELVLNLHDSVRLFAGVGYRFTAGIFLPRVNSDGLNGFNIDVGAEGGIF